MHVWPEQLGQAGGEAGELLPAAHARIGDAAHHAKPCPFGAVAISKQESAISKQESAGPRRLAPQAAEGQSRAAPAPRVVAAPWALSLKAPLLAADGAAALAEALAAAGFNTVIVIERQNHLARLVSSFENRVRLCGNHQ